MAALSLVADIGGTNSRFALYRHGTLEMLETRRLPNRDFPNLEAAIEEYLRIVDQEPKRACLAIAGPITGDSVRMTNIDWQFSRSDMRRHFQLSELQFVNDFTALAMAVPHLTPDLLIKSGGANAVKDMPIAVLGPGTGLGVSGLLWAGRQWVALQGEGGNVSFSPSDAKEIELLRYAQTKIDFVRAEDFISGSGLPFLHEALAAVEGRAIEKLATQEISRRGLSGECGQCTETLMTFCGMLGSFAGDVALTLGARGGVYIGGGVVPILGDFFLRSPFRLRFENKGKFADYVRPIPTYVMLSFTEMALIGAAAILNNTEE